MIDNAKVIDKLVGFIFGFTSGVKVLVNENGPLPSTVEETSVGGLRVFAFVSNMADGVHVVFQLGTEHVQTDVDSYIAKNTISIIIANSSCRIRNSRTYGQFIDLSSTENMKHSIKEAVMLFNDLFTESV